MRAEEQRTDRRIAEKAAKEQWEASAGCRERVERILAELPDTSEQEETGMRKIWSRRTLILAAALAAVVGTTAMASGLFRWDQKAVENFRNPTEEDQNAMTMEGLAKEQIASAADAGITVTAKQTVQDKNTLYILLDIQAEEEIIDGNGGFDRPGENGDDELPWIITEHTDAFNSVSMGFAPDTPAFSELSDHGYYEINALKSLDQEWDEEQIEIHFTEYSYYTYENGDTVPHTIHGDWALTLPLGEDTILKTDLYEPDAPVEIAGVSVRVKRIEVSPLSLILSFDMDDLNELQETCYAGETDVYLKEVAFTGFLDQNGDEILTGVGGMSGKYDFDNREIIHQMGLGTYVDPSDLSAVLLGDEKTEVPLK